jgi:transposase
MERIFTPKTKAICVPPYPSDITREQFETIRPLLESTRKKTKPRTVDLYDVFCGMLYVLKTGCQWRALPHEYPKWSTVYAYFQQWSEQEKGQKSILEQVLKKIRWRGAYVQWTERAHHDGHR